MFGKTTNTTGFVSYAGDDFALKLPVRWIPSREREFSDIVLRYEDNFDHTNSLFVAAVKSDKSSITDVAGSPEAWLEANGDRLFGLQSWEGSTISEGGFAPGSTSAASILDISQVKDAKGRAVYKYHVLVRTADGDEGGRHYLISTLVANGKLYTFCCCVGDKRWFKGVKNDALGSQDSFTVA